MRIEAGVLLSIEEKDIKKGILKLPNTVKKIGIKVIIYNENLIEVYAPKLKIIRDDNFKYCNNLTTFNAPNLEEIRDHNFYGCKTLTTFNAPKLKIIRDHNFYGCNNLTTFNAPKLKIIRDHNFYGCNALTTFNAPKLKIIRDHNFNSCNTLTTFNAPKLEEIGNDNFYDCNTLTTFNAPNLEEIIRGDNFYGCNNLTTFNAPKLEEIGNDNFKYCNNLTTFNAPKLEEIGNDNFKYCNALTTFSVPNLEEIGDDNFNSCNTLTTLKLGEHKLKVKFIDNNLFVIEREKITKGIKIYTGFNFKGMNNNTVINNKTIYVAEQDNLYAHGYSVKEAMKDLRFKIVSEKLKKTPIKKDSKITVLHYRTVTGACDLGCREFMEINKIPFKIENGKTVELNPIKAEDLLLILKTNNAYGLEKFRRLLTE